MATGSRIKRGFTRLGIVAAIPFLLGAVIALGAFAVQPTIQRDDWSQFPTTPPNYFDRFDTPATSPTKPPGLFDDLVPQKKPAPTPKQIARTNSEPLFWAAAAGITAMLVFLVCWSMGWVIAGFARE